jgi:hypothetical protein
MAAPPLVGVAGGGLNVGRAEGLASLRGLVQSGLEAGSEPLVQVFAVGQYPLAAKRISPTTAAVDQVG